MGSLNVKGVGSLLSGLDKLQTSTLKSIDTELTATSMEIVADAKTALQAQNVVDTGTLIQGVQMAKDAPFDKIVRSNANYSAYVEFGTGTLVDVPKGLEDYARQFKGKGIKQVNLPARPFFIPSYLKHTKNIVERLKQIIESGNKR